MLGKESSYLDFAFDPDWEAATEIKIGMQKRLRRAPEAALITTRELSNHMEGFVKRSAGCAAKTALRSSGEAEEINGLGRRISGQMEGFVRRAGYDAN